MELKEKFGIIDLIVLFFSNEYYGGMWASFNFDGLQKWLGECQDKSNELEHETTDNLLKDGESLVKAGSQFATVFNIEEKWFIGE